jgi:hypothetical protein
MPLIQCHLVYQITERNKHNSSKAELNKLTFKQYDTRKPLAHLQLEANTPSNNTLKEGVWRVGFQEIQLKFHEKCFYHPVVFDLRNGKEVTWPVLP